MKYIQQITDDMFLHYYLSCYQIENNSGLFTYMVSNKGSRNIDYFITLT